MKINWKIRLQNKTFWITIISAIFVFITTVGAAFGIDLNLTGVQNTILTLVETIFSVLAVLGVLIDPTTKGTNDSERALAYEELG